MMSDGFPEAPNPDGELLSYETVEKCLLDNIDKDVTTMQDELVRITDEWLAGGDLPDDCTMGDFMYVIRKRIKIPPERSIFLFVADMKQAMLLFKSSEPLP